jgi:hypothetical protein
MKRIYQVLPLLFCFVMSVELSAQKAADTLQFAERVWAMKKKAAVLEYMNLTEAEKAAFWPVYDSYSGATQHLEIECMHLLAKYSRDYNELSPGKLEGLSTRILRNDLMLAKLRKQFFKRFKKALSARQASAFMQLDTEFRTMLRADMQRNSPSMGILQDALATKASIK